MKTLLYSLIAVGSSLAILPANASPLFANPAPMAAEASHETLEAAPKAFEHNLKSFFRKAPKKPTRAVLVFSGYEKSKGTMSSVRRDWQLHVRQNHVKSQALRQARSRRAHWQK